MYSSNPGDLVFDPFLGSGTVAVGAQQKAGISWVSKLSRNICLCTGRPAVPVKSATPSCRLALKECV